MANINYHIVEFKNVTAFALRAVIEKHTIDTPFGRVLRVYCRNEEYMLCNLKQKGTKLIFTTNNCDGCHAIKQLCNYIFALFEIKTKTVVEIAYESGYYCKCAILSNTYVDNIDIDTELDEKKEARREFIINTFRNMLNSERNLFSL